MAITTNSLISRQTVGSAGAASITFSNIPQTYTDLRIVVSARSVRSAVNDVLYMTVNGSTTTYSSRVLEGNGAAAFSYSGGSTAFSDILGIPAASSTTSVFSNAEIYIPNYTSANYKSISANSVGENNATTAYTDLYAGLWSNTTAITSINLYNIISNFTEYSTFSLYGISSSTSTQNTSVPSAIGGDVITTDGTYWYHAFKYSGTFTPLKALTADCLVIAGGGAGGGDFSSGAGGGGAGGLCYQSSRSLITSNYTVTIGAGGATAGRANGNSGVNSIFDTITALGGGGGGRDYFAGSSGGSGGGAGGGNTLSGGSATQGNSGGATGFGNKGGDDGVDNSAGGGGAGAAGANTTTTPSAGGIGVNTYSTWASATVTGVSGYYAGGGGGAYGTSAAGGTGGGGAGGNPAVAGTANTGGGGGGRSGAGSGGGAAGGSGIVIVRYAV